MDGEASMANEAGARGPASLVIEDLNKDMEGQGSTSELGGGCLTTVQEAPLSPPSKSLLLYVEYRVGSEDAGDRDYITIYDYTTAVEVCRSLASRHGLPEEEQEQLALVMVYPTREEDGSLTRIMHTLKPTEKPIQEREKVFRRKQHVVGAFTRDQLLENDLITWCLKDTHAGPLDLPGYVSGSEASEDEEHAPWNDMAQVGQGYYSGYLLKKSNRDACLWRRRWCILGEDKIWYMKRKDQGKQSWQGRAAFISLVSNFVMEHESPSVRYGIEVHTAHRVFVFRAADRPQQMLWINAIKTRIELSSENDLIRLAELMICDEELARARRSQQAVESFWSAKHINCERVLVDREAAQRQHPSQPQLLLLPSEAGDQQQQAQQVSPRPLGSGISGSTLRLATVSPSSLVGGGGGGGGRADSPGLSSSYLAPSTQPCPLRSSLLFKRGTELADGLALTMAVQDFRELCRHDRKVANAKKWEVAQRIFDEFLRGRAQPPVADGVPRGGGMGRRRPLFTHEAVQEVESHLTQYEAFIRDSRVDGRTAVRITRGEGMPSVSELLGNIRQGRGTGASLAEDLGKPPPVTLFDAILAELTPGRGEGRQAATGTMRLAREMEMPGLDKRQKQLDYHSFLDAQVAEKAWMKRHDETDPNVQAQGGPGQRHRRLSFPTMEQQAAASRPSEHHHRLGMEASDDMLPAGAPSSRGTPFSAAGDLEFGAAIGLRRLQGRLERESELRKSLESQVGWLEKQLDRTGHESSMAVAKQMDLFMQEKESMAGVRDRLRVVEAELLAARSWRNQVDQSVTDIRQTTDTLAALLDQNKRTKEDAARRDAESQRLQQVTQLAQSLPVQVEVSRRDLLLGLDATNDKLAMMETAIGANIDRITEMSKRMNEDRALVVGQHSQLELKLERLHEDIRSVRSALKNEEGFRRATTEGVMQAVNATVEGLVRDLEDVKGTVNKRLMVMNELGIGLGGGKEGPGGKDRSSLQEAFVQQILTDFEARVQRMEARMMAEATAMARARESTLSEMAARWAEWVAGRDAETAAHATRFDLFRTDVGGQVEDVERRIKDILGALADMERNWQDTTGESLVSLHGSVDTLEQDFKARFQELEGVVSAEITARKRAIERLTDATQRLDLIKRDELSQACAKLQNCIEDADRRLIALDADIHKLGKTCCEYTDTEVAGLKGKLKEEIQRTREDAAQGLKDVREELEEKSTELWEGLRDERERLEELAIKEERDIVELGKECERRLLEGLEHAHKELTDAITEVKEDLITRLEEESEALTAEFKHGLKELGAMEAAARELLAQDLSTRLEWTEQSLEAKIQLVEEMVQEESRDLNGKLVDEHTARVQGDHANEKLIREVERNAELALFETRLTLTDEIRRVDAERTAAERLNHMIAQIENRDLAAKMSTQRESLQNALNQVDAESRQRDKALEGSLAQNVSILRDLVRATESELQEKRRELEQTIEGHVTRIHEDIVGSTTRIKELEEEVSTLAPKEALDAAVNSITKEEKRVGGLEQELEKRWHETVDALDEMVTTLQGKETEVNERLAFIMSKLDTTDVDLLSMRSDIKLMEGQVGAGGGSGKGPGPRPSSSGGTTPADSARSPSRPVASGNIRSPRPKLPSQPGGKAGPPVRLELPDDELPEGPPQAGTGNEDSPKSSRSASSASHEDDDDDLADSASVSSSINDLRSPGFVNMSASFDDSRASQQASPRSTGSVASSRSGSSLQSPSRRSSINNSPAPRRVSLADASPLNRRPAHGNPESPSRRSSVSMTPSALNRRPSTTVAPTNGSRRPSVAGRRPSTTSAPQQTPSRRPSVASSSPPLNRRPSTTASTTSLQRASNATSRTPAERRPSVAASPPPPGNRRPSTAAVSPSPPRPSSTTTAPPSQNPPTRRSSVAASPPPSANRRSSTTAASPSPPRRPSTTTPSQSSAPTRRTSVAAPPQQTAARRQSTATPAPQSSGTAAARRPSVASSPPPVTRRPSTTAASPSPPRRPSDVASPPPPAVRRPSTTAASPSPPRRPSVSPPPPTQPASRRPSTTTTTPDRNPPARRPSVGSSPPPPTRQPSTAATPPPPSGRASRQEETVSSPPPSTPVAPSPAPSPPRRPSAGASPPPSVSRQPSTTSIAEEEDPIADSTGDSRTVSDEGRLPSFVATPQQSPPRRPSVGPSSPLMSRRPSTTADASSPLNQRPSTTAAAASPPRRPSVGGSPPSPVRRPSTTAAASQQSPPRRPSVGDTSPPPASRRPSATAASSSPPRRPSTTAASSQGPPTRRPSVGGAPTTAASRRPSIGASPPPATRRPSTSAATQQSSPPRRPSAGSSPPPPAGRRPSTSNVGASPPPATRRPSTTAASSQDSPPRRLSVGATMPPGTRRVSATPAPSPSPPRRPSTTASSQPPAAARRPSVGGSPPPGSRRPSTAAASSAESPPRRLSVGASMPPGTARRSSVTPTASPSPPRRPSTSTTATSSSAGRPSVGASPPPPANRRPSTTAAASPSPPRRPSASSSSQSPPPARRPSVGASPPPGSRRPSATAASQSGPGNSAASSPRPGTARRSSATPAAAPSPPRRPNTSATATSSSAGRPSVGASPPPPANRRPSTTAAASPSPPRRPSTTSSSQSPPPARRPSVGASPPPGSRRPSATAASQNGPASPPIRRPSTSATASSSPPRRPSVVAAPPPSSARRPSTTAAPPPQQNPLQSPPRRTSAAIPASPLNTRTPSTAASLSPPRRPSVAAPSRRSSAAPPGDSPSRAPSQQQQQQQARPTSSARRPSQAGPPPPSTSAAAGAGARRGSALSSSPPNRRPSQAPGAAKNSERPSSTSVSPPPARRSSVERRPSTTVDTIKSPPRRPSSVSTTPVLAGVHRPSSNAGASTSSNKAAPTATGGGSKTAATAAPAPAAQARNPSTSSSSKPAPSASGGGGGSTRPPPSGAGGSPARPPPKR